jgi:hypothetical protein
VTRECRAVDSDGPGTVAEVATSRATRWARLRRDSKDVFPSPTPVDLQSGGVLTPINPRRNRTPGV